MMSFKRLLVLLLVSLGLLACGSTSLKDLAETHAEAALEPLFEHFEESLAIDSVRYNCTIMDTLFNDNSSELKTKYTFCEYYVTYRLEGSAYVRFAVVSAERYDEGDVDVYLYGLETAEALNRAENEFFRTFENWLAWLSDEGGVTEYIRDNGELSRNFIRNVSTSLND